MNSTSVSSSPKLPSDVGYAVMKEVPFPSNSVTSTFVLLPAETAVAFSFIGTSTSEAELTAEAESKGIIGGSGIDEISETLALGE